MHIENRDNIMKSRRNYKIYIQRISMLKIKESNEYSYNSCSVKLLKKVKRTAKQFPKLGMLTYVSNLTVYIYVYTSPNHY